DRDRMVLELNLTQGLDGEDLADALGVKVGNAYQMTHRMKERLERSMAALLVVMAGRDQCADLDGVAKKWDGEYDVLWRKRFARHLDRCERCQKMRSKLPKAVLSGAALSQAAQSAVLAAPISVRDRVLSEGPSIIGSETAKAWSSDGFPKVATQRRGFWRYLAGAAMAVVLVVGLAEAVGDGIIPLDVSTTPDPVPSTTVPSTAVPSTTVPGDVSSTMPPDTPGGGSSGGSDSLGGTSPGATTSTPAGRNPTTTVVEETPPREDPRNPGDTTPTTPEQTPDPSPNDPYNPPTDVTPRYDPPTYDPKNPPPVYVPPPVFYVPSPTLFIPPPIVTTGSIPTLN
ncbi:MAG: hypothetical protein ACR2OH_08445, partial [Microthrixaceae bacterium]